MIRRTVSLGVLGLAVAISSPGRTGEPASGPPGDRLRVYTATMKSTQAWLALVDEGRYGESWDHAAKLFRAAVTRATWERGAAAARGPFGKLLSRKVKGAEYKTSLPGAPDGESVVVQFDATFEKKKDAVETVTPMREADGSWKVSGYFVR